MLGPEPDLQKTPEEIVISCSARILRIRHLSNKLYQGHTIHQTFSWNTLLHAVSRITWKDVHKRATCRKCISHRSPDPDTTLLPTISRYKHIILAVVAILPTDLFGATREIPGMWGPVIDESTLRGCRHSKQVRYTDTALEPATIDGFCENTTPNVSCGTVESH